MVTVGGAHASMDAHLQPQQAKYAAARYFANTQGSDVSYCARWRPRSGRNRAYRTWTRGVDRLVNALGITQEQLEETHFQTPQDYIVKAENDDDAV